MQETETVLNVIRDLPPENDHWRARYGETRPAGVRREALRCIPDAVGMNSEGGSWVA
jgi:hypothetical protein